MSTSLSSSFFLTIYLINPATRRMPPYRERAHRTTRSNPIVIETGTASSPIRNVAGLASGLQSTTASTFGCPQCAKVFNRRENLSRHLKTHEESPAHRCSKCDKAFTRSDLLKRHELGHERWTKNDRAEQSTNRSSKRRRVAFEDPVIAGVHDQVIIEPSPVPGTFEQGEGGVASTKDSAAEDQEHLIGQISSASDAPSFISQSIESAPVYNFQSALTEATPADQIQSSNHHEQLDTQFHHSQHLSSTEYQPFGTFDFSSFLLPSHPDPLENEWFSNDFYSAMRETGNDWGTFGELLDPNFLSPGQDGFYAPSNRDDLNDNILEKVPRVQQAQSEEAEESNGENPHQGRISRISSPPNEASEEDKWPFQWNPNSRPILNSNPIVIPDDHPLLRDHNSKFDISEGTFLRLQAFLKTPAGGEFHKSQKGSFVLPSLPIVNVFIYLFFEHFSPKMPVLHHPTINPNSDLPPPLLASMIIIGATYSHLKHTRRFSIVLLDLVRWNLQFALEYDNSLLREPMIIFAELLICYAGLWCGNKRAFELAEALRGVVVTHIRRFQSTTPSNSKIEYSSKANINVQWRQWIAEESRKRLYWTAYALDAQFPSLLNLPATIAIGEVSDLGCPCDEEFWCASSARNWKNLLGPASVPPSRSFAAAVGPFVLSSQQRSGSKRRNILEQASFLPILDLNPWSAFLVLMTIQNQVYQYSQESLLSRTFLDDDEMSEGCEDDMQEAFNGGGHSSEDINSILRAQQAQRRDKLACALSLWSKTYSVSKFGSTSKTCHHFQAASTVVYQLSTILLDIELLDLQNALGKDGTTGIPRAIINLSRWARRSPRGAENVAFNAVKTIVSLAVNRSVHDHSAPYSIIALFLCHLILWIFATVSPPDEKQRLLERVDADEILCSSQFSAVLRSALSIQIPSSQPGSSRRVDSQIILFKNGAEMLTQLGTWGASLNLALLIHRRAEMS